MRLIDKTSGAERNQAGTPQASPAAGNAPAPQLKELVTEATCALARLDVERLQELALSCEALTRVVHSTTPEQREELSRQSLAARGDMAVFARVLEATRANVKVMERLRNLRTGSAGYSEVSDSYLGPRRRNSEGEYGNN